MYFSIQDASSYPTLFVMSSSWLLHCLLDSLECSSDFKLQKFASSSSSLNFTLQFVSIHFSKNMLAKIPIKFPFKVHQVNIRISSQSNRALLLEQILAWVKLHWQLPFNKTWKFKFSGIFHGKDNQFHQSEVFYLFLYLIVTIHRSNYWRFRAKVIAFNW